MVSERQKEPRWHDRPGRPASGCGWHAAAEDPARTAGLGRQALGQLAERGDLFTLRAGDVLIREGENSDDLFLIIEGVLMLTKSLPAGRLQGVGFRFADDLVLLRRCGTASPATVRAISASRVRRINCADLRRLCSSNVHVGQLLLDLSSDEIAARQEQLLIVGRANKEERIAAFLVELQRQSQSNASRRAELVLPMHRPAIAAYLGLSTETVSRSFTRLASEGVIDLPSPSRVRILNRGALERLAEGRHAGYRRSMAGVDAVT